MKTFDYVPPLFLKGQPGNPDHFYPWHGTVLDPTTTPNSNSLYNLSTGISLNGFGFSGGYLIFNANYQLGEPPVYSMVIRPQVTPPETLSGTVYFQNAGYFLHVDQGSTIDIAPRSSPLNGPHRAIGTETQPITFRAIGYGSYRPKWGYMSIANNLSTPKQFRFCQFRNGTYGLYLEGYHSTNPMPIVRSCSFADCDYDMRVHGNSSSTVFDISGLDSNTYSTMILDGYVKLSNADFISPASSTLFFGNTSSPLSFQVNNRNMNVLGPVNMLWQATLQGNSLMFSQDLTVPAGRTLTAGPNTTLLFADSKSLSVSGTFSSIGTTANLITLGRSSGSGTWSGIYAASPTSSPSVTLSYTTIEHADIAVNAATHTALSMSNCTVDDAAIGVQIVPDAGLPHVGKQILSCSFSNITNTGVYVENFSDLLMQENVLIGKESENQTFGVLLRHASPTLYSNRIDKFTYGLSCEQGSTPILQRTTVGAHNVIRYNQYGVRCTDASHALLGGDEGDGQNSIYGNTIWAAVIAGGSKVTALYNWWGTPEDPGYLFSVDESSVIYYNPWLPEDPNPGMSLTGGKLVLTEEGGGETTLLPSVMRDVIRARVRRQYSQASVLLRSIITDGSQAFATRQWAARQLLAVAQMMRSPNLSAYIVNVLNGNPPIVRDLRSILPGSYIHELSLTSAVATYDQNIQRYPNSELERDALYGRFLYALYNRGDLT
ncbi:MAG: right-handed parallel beta-helix repeat-containing protein, partial [Bacteroidota bacterium]